MIFKPSNFNMYKITASMQNQLTKKNTVELLKFAQSAAKLGNKLILDTNSLTPVNFEEEKKKFFKSASYNPQFIYRKKKVKEEAREISSLHINLNNLNLPSALKNYLKKYLNNLYHQYIALQSIGTNSFSNSARLLFNWDIENIRNIKKSLPEISAKTSKENPKNALTIKKAFEDCLRQKYSIQDYPIEIDNFNGHIISDGLTKLKIGKFVKRNNNNIKRLLVHELESHILQKRNVRLSKNPMLKLVTYKDIMVYAEGLAVYNEFKTKTITKSAYDIYKARLEAVEISHKSFREIYNHLLKFVSEDKSYLTTYRLKRGLKNTKHPGGLPKDASYLEGYTLLREMEKKGDDIEKLYLYRVPKLGKLLLEYNLLQTKEFLLPRFTSH